MALKQAGGPSFSALHALKSCPPERQSSFTTTCDPEFPLGAMQQQLTPPDSDMPPLEDHDWASRLPQTDHVRFFRETDWAGSRLGPLKDWSPTLKLFTRMLFADSRAACLWWYGAAQYSRLVYAMY